MVKPDVFVLSFALSFRDGLDWRQGAVIVHHRALRGCKHSSRTRIYGALVPDTVAERVARTRKLGQANRVRCALSHSDSRGLLPAIGLSGFDRNCCGPLAVPAKGGCLAGVTTANLRGDKRPTWRIPTAHKDNSPHRATVHGHPNEGDGAPGPDASVFGSPDLVENKGCVLLIRLTGALMADSGTRIRKQDQMDGRGRDDGR